MITIRLFCVMGMSTSLITNKMKETAQHMGIELDVAAYSETDLDKCLDGVDVVFLAPQARYIYKRAKAVCEPKNIVLSLISSIEYGELDGEGILKRALEMTGKN